MLKEFDQDTIAAISTPIGEGGIGIVRLSGQEALSIADKIFKSKNGIPVLKQENFTVRYGHVVVPGSDKIVDEALISVMRGPKSFTAEDVAEISVHGGPAVLQTVLRLCLEAGARLAARGEFTKRAFLNGRIDLLQAEAVLDLVKARTEMPRQWATLQLDGALSRKMKEIKNELLDILSHLEASVDFPEDRPETDPLSETAERLKKISNEIKDLLASFAMGSIAKSGLKIVIAGRPNVGKSSLMNQLAKKNRVIVTPYAGTTRDVVEEEIQIGGFPVRIFDTAGIQETAHPIEKEGIERSKLAVSEADLVLYALDGHEPLAGEDKELLSGLCADKCFIVINKSDLPSRINEAALKSYFPQIPVIKTSCVNECGLKELEEKIFGFMTHGKCEVSSDAVITTVRQEDFLSKVFKNIENARQGCLQNISPELVSVDIRSALDHLGSLVGEAVNDDMLDILFDKFCIGK